MAAISFDKNLIEQNTSGASTMVGFDIDQMKTDTHLLLEQYHIFSKTPAAPTTALGGARNKAGHTTTSSDIWSQEIPAFFKAYSDDDLTRFATLAKKNDLVLLAYKKSETEPNGAVLKFVDGTWTKIHDSIASIPDGTEFYNSVDTKPVIRFHQNSAAVILSGDNNNTDGSNGFSAKICSWDESTNAPFPASALKFVPQFVSSMDKMINGIPSSGYDAIVKVGTTEDDILAESPSSPAGYIANNYAGIIHFNTARADNQIYVHAFEYIGEKLDASLSGIRKDVQDIIGTTMEGVVASVGTNEAATSAGIGVDSTTKTSPKITFTAGSVETGETKLVSGGAVKTYVDTTALTPETGSIAKAITSAINALGDVAVKSDIKISDIKVKVGSGTATSLTPDGDKSVTIEIPDAPEAVVTAEGTVTTDGFTKTAAVTSLANAAINAAITDTENGAIAGAIDQGISNATATVGTDGSITKAGLVTAADAKTIAEKAITTAVADGGTIDNRIDTLISNATSTSAIVDNDTSTKLVTAAQVATYVASEVGAIDTGIVGVNTNIRPDGVTISSTINGIALSETADNKVKLNIRTALEGQSVGGGSDTWGGTFADAYALTTGEQAQSIAKYEANKAVKAKGIDHINYHGYDLSGSISLFIDGDTPQTLNVTGAEYTPATAIAAGSWTNSYALATGEHVEAAIADAVKEVKDYADAKHTTSLDYVVLGDNETLPTASADTLGKIYLVKEGNTANGETNIDAISGSYVEYMTRKIGDGESATYAWEKIGTTAADLSGYAKTVTINGQTYNVTANTVALGAGFANNVATGQATTLANQGSVYANISTDGTLTVGVDDGSTSAKGLVQLDNMISSHTSETTAATPKAVKAYADTKVGSVNYCNAYCLKSETMQVTNGVLNIGHQWVSGTAHLSVNAVINNVSFNGNPEDSIGVIETNMINDGSSMFENNGLTTFDSNLDNLEKAYRMMYQAGIETFAVDMPRLK